MLRVLCKLQRRIINQREYVCKLQRRIISQSLLYTDTMQRHASLHTATVSMSSMIVLLLGLSCCWLLYWQFYLKSPNLSCSHQGTVASN